MAVIFIDGFDKYGPTGTVGAAAAIAASAWTVALNGGPGIVAGLSLTGYALQFLGGTALAKTLSTSYSRLIGGVRVNAALDATHRAPLLQFQDAGTAQCSVQVNIATGTISLVTGAYGGTAVATSSASVSNGSTHYLEWDISFGAAASYQLWLDGVSIFSGTGNTKTTGNSSANGFQIGVNGGAQNLFSVDDLYLFDSTGSTNNAVLLTTPRIETEFPTGDSQTQWTNVANIVGQNYSTTASTNAPGANTLFLERYQAPVSCNLQSVSCVPKATSATANFKAVVYADSAGSPGSLIATGTAVTGTTSGTTLTGPFSSGQALTGGTFYWLGFITDTSVVLQETDATTVGQQAANTYTSGAPASAPTMTSGKPNWTIWGNCTGATTNWETQSVNPAPGDASSISSSTVGQEDLYSFPSLSVSPSAIHTVVVSALAKRSDSGARTISLHVKSGSTDGTGSLAGQTPALSYAFVTSVFDTDPNTSAAWTATALNAATAGLAIAA